jgi:hypothetical protein
MRSTTLHISTEPRHFVLARVICWRFITRNLNRSGQVAMWHNGRQVGEVAEGLACSVAAIAPNCGYMPPFLGCKNILPVIA